MLPANEMSLTLKEGMPDESTSNQFTPYNPTPFMPMYALQPPMSYETRLPPLNISFADFID